MSVFFFYCICAFICRCRSFNQSLCRLSPFPLSYVVVKGAFFIAY